MAEKLGRCMGKATARLGNVGSWRGKLENRGGEGPVGPSRFMACGGKNSRGRINLKFPGEGTKKGTLYRGGSKGGGQDTKTQ